MKDDMGGPAIEDFVGLKPKIGDSNTDSSEYKKQKMSKKTLLRN